MRRVAAAAFIALAALCVLPAASAQQTPNTTVQWYGNAPFPEAYQSVNAVGSGSFVLTSQPGTSSNLMVTYGAASGTQQLSQGLPKGLMACLEACRTHGKLHLFPLILKAV